MPNTVSIKTFEEILAELNADLTTFGSQITNAQEGGAYDLIKRACCRILADAYQILDLALDQAFIDTATGDWLDLKAVELGTTRLNATKTIKEFTLRRISTSGVLQVAVGDIIKSPVVPNRTGRLRFFSILSTNSILAAAGLAGQFENGIGEITVRFEAEDGGTDYNNIEEQLNQATVEFEIESGLSGVDEVESTGEDVTPGTNAETDAELRERLKTRWAILATGATRQAYIEFAKEASNQVYDANVTENQPGGNPVDVEVAVSGPPGSRALIIGKNASTNNFDPDYTSDGLPSIVTGTQDGGDNQSILTDSTAQFITDGGVRVGDIVKNLTDGSQGVITARTETTITATLSGGTENDWDNGDVAEIDRNNGSTTDAVTIALGNLIHTYIRTRCPSTDLIYLYSILVGSDYKSVDEVTTNLDVDIEAAEGHVAADVKTLVETRLSAFFTVQPIVEDVEPLEVGEKLLFSALCTTTGKTPGVADYKFNTPVPDNDVTANKYQVLIEGTITVGDL